MYVDYTRGVREPTMFCAKSICPPCIFSYSATGCHLCLCSSGSDDKDDDAKIYSDGACIYNNIYNIYHTCTITINIYVWLT